MGFIGNILFFVINMLKAIFTRLYYGAEEKKNIKSIYNIMEKDGYGKKVKMSDFQGYVLCIVNVASKWSLTAKNYTELSKLVDEYGPSGFKVLNFPCNQFGFQEPGTHEEILKFVEENYQASNKFTWFEKGDVLGAETRDVFSFVKNELPSKDGTTEISWNFTKFLVTHEGKPYKRYGPRTPPVAMKLAIEDLLKNKKESEQVKGD